MRKIFLVSIIIVFCGIACFAQTDAITDEEYAVYLTVLGKTATGFVVRDKSAVEDLGSAGLDRSDWIKKTFDLRPETWGNFREQNNKSYQVERKFSTKNDYLIMSQKEYNEFFDHKMDWEGFYKKYPGSDGFYTFSRVGFSKDHKDALVFVSFGCGSTCGEGDFYHLKKDGDEWKISKKQMTWIS